MPRLIDSHVRETVRLVSVLETAASRDGLRVTVVFDCEVGPDGARFYSTDFHDAIENRRNAAGLVGQSDRSGG